jgi:hypothetical protein
MLLAQEFVLLALDPDGRPARGHAYQPAAAIGVTGALITELSQQGHLDLGDGRIRLTGTRPAHGLLQQVLDSVAAHEGMKLKSRLSSIKHSGWSEVVDLMIDEGLLGRQKEPLHPTRHPVLCLDAQQQIQHRVRAAAISDEPMDERTAALLALAGPSQLLEVVAPDRADRTHAKRRISEASDRVPAAEAVQYAVEAAAIASV